MEAKPALLPLGPMARILGVSCKWLRAECEAGRIPHLPAGNTILFDADLVEKVLGERARQTPNGAQQSPAVETTQQAVDQEENRRSIAEGVPAA